MNTFVRVTYFYFSRVSVCLIVDTFVIVQAFT